MIEGYEFEYAIADKAYDSDDLLDIIAEKEATAIIPPRSNRKETREYDKHMYKERHLMECFINKIKWYRRVFSRFDKLARRYTAFLHLSGALILLR